MLKEAFDSPFSTQAFHGMLDWKIETLSKGRSNLQCLAISETKASQNENQYIVVSLLVSGVVIPISQQKASYRYLAASEIVRHLTARNSLRTGPP